MTTFDQETEHHLQEWLSGHYDEETKQEIRRLIKENPKEIMDSFYTTLSFGTAGLRGVMGVGSNRMNRYTVASATQGLANYVNQQKIPEGGHSVLIGYDSRHHSKEFAEVAARVLAGNGIQVYIYKELRPTPLVSFGCRLKKCSAAIMITASHNPPQYNGYKVYWNDGGQVLPPHDVGIIKEVKQIKDLNQIKMLESIEDPFIQWIGEEIDQEYLKTIEKLQTYPKDNKSHGASLKVVYTSLHGTGITLMPEALKSWGFTNIQLVEKQCIPDGNFPTAHFPNPEEKEALKLGIEALKSINGDILIATDPDADRIGVVFMHQGEIKILNGNQIACLCLHHILEGLSSQGKLPERAACIKTVVTSEMFRAIADAYKCHCTDVLTGFKYIAEKIRIWEQEPKGYRFIFGAEESYGCLYGTQTRDKDAIIAGILLCEIALHTKLQGKTLLDQLYSIYEKQGVFDDKVISIAFEETKEGHEKMRKAMERLRTSSPKDWNGKKVIALDDYFLSVHTEPITNKTTLLTLPKSDVLVYWLEDGSKLVVRPSGTEPKVKVYCSVREKSEKDIRSNLDKSQKKIDALLSACVLYIKG